MEVQLHLPTNSSNGRIFTNFGHDSKIRERPNDMGNCVMKEYSKVLKAVAWLQASVIAAASILLSSCSSGMLEDRLTAEDDGITVTIETGAQDEATPEPQAESRPGSRTCFGEKTDGAYTTLWTTNKSAQFSVNGDTFVSATPSVSDGGRSASFTVTFASTSATEGTVYGFSPKGTYSKNGSCKGGFTTIYSTYGSTYLVIPAAQTPLADSPDEAAQAVWGKAEYSDGLPTSVNMHFSHITAYGKMALQNYEGGTVSTVSITFPTAVAGNSVSFFYKDGTYYSTPYDEGSLVNANVSTITIDAANARDNVFWFGLMPVGELSSGSMVITVTDTDSKSYTRTVQLSADRSISFRKGRVTSFVVDMEGTGTDSGDDEYADNDGLAYGSCYEMPAISVPQSALPFSKSGSLVNDYGDADYWLNASTGTSGQVYVVHRTKSGTDYIRNFSLLHDSSKKAALWVAYAFNGTTWKDGNVGRNDNWVYDPALSTSSQPDLTSSYPDSNYDRGHQAASNDRQTTVAGNRQTFYFSNMTPQYADLNQNNWASLENRIQTFGWSCKTTDTLYVVTGPVFEDGWSTTTDKNGLSCPVPSRYYKCMMKCSFNSSGAMTGAVGVAYLTPGNNASSDTAWTGWITTIDAVEQLTGLNFFANVPEALQTAAEKTNAALF